MNIKIKSLDVYGQHYEKEFQLIKIVHTEDLKEYHYNDEHGRNKIRKKYSSIEILRQGSVNSRQVFKLREKTSFIYILDGFKKKYEIFTKRMNINDSKILLEYDIMDKNEIINSIKLEITYF